MTLEFIMKLASDFETLVKCIPFYLELASIYMHRDFSYSLIYINTHQFHNRITLCFSHFPAGYLRLADIFKIGFITALVNFSIWTTVGMGWWKLLGLY